MMQTIETIVDLPAPSRPEPKPDIPPAEKPSRTLRPLPEADSPYAMSYTPLGSSWSELLLMSDGRYVIATMALEGMCGREMGRLAVSAEEAARWCVKNGLVDDSSLPDEVQSHIDALEV